MNKHDTIHLIRPTRGEHNFRFELDAEDQYVLLWSQSQHAFHIERHKHMMESNRRAYADDRRMDYALLFLGTHDFCCRQADLLRRTLASRALAREHARTAVRTAAYAANESPTASGPGLTAQSGGVLGRAGTRRQSTELDVPQRPNMPAFNDILNALDRQATALEFQRDKLAEAGNYDAMFPEADAEMLREAEAFLRRLQGN